MYLDITCCLVKQSLISLNTSSFTFVDPEDHTNDGFIFIYFSYIHVNCIDKSVIMPPKKSPAKRKADKVSGGAAPAASEPKRSKTAEVGTEYRKFRTDGPLKCTWYPGTKEKNPHLTRPMYVKWMLHTQ